MLEKILISACLFGEKVRYDGQGKLLSHPAFLRWQKEGRLVAACPEVAGGLPTPRPAAEIIGSDGGAGVLNRTAQVIDNQQSNVSDAFLLGAQQVLELCQKHNIRFAVLTARSPSCGNEQIYDGQFSGQLVQGQGVTAALLEQKGIRVFNQYQLDVLAQVLEDLLDK